MLFVSKGIQVDGRSGLENADRNSEKPIGDLKTRIGILETRSGFWKPDRGIENPRRDFEKTIGELKTRVGIFGTRSGKWKPPVGISENRSGN
jgi:hypothetical protein